MLEDDRGKSGARMAQACWLEGQTQESVLAATQYLEGLKEATRIPPLGSAPEGEREGQKQEVRHKTFYVPPTIPEQDAREEMIV